MKALSVFLCCEWMENGAKSPWVNAVEEEEESWEQGERGGWSPASRWIRHGPLSPSFIFKVNWWRGGGRTRNNFLGAGSDSTTTWEGKNRAKPAIDPSVGWFLDHRCWCYILSCSVSYHCTVWSSMRSVNFYSEHKKNKDNKKILVRCFESSVPTTIHYLWCIKNRWLKD